MSTYSVFSVPNTLYLGPYVHILCLFGHKYSVARPKLQNKWNKLPLNIRQSSSVTVSNASLKTHFFQDAFDFLHFYHYPEQHRYDCYLIYCLLIIHCIAFFSQLKSAMDNWCRMTLNKYFLFTHSFIYLEITSAFKW